MGLIKKLKSAFRRPSLQEKAILRHEDAFAKSLKLPIRYLDIVDKFNAFDWLDLHEAKSPEDQAAVVLRFFKLFNFKYLPQHESIILKAFTHQFNEAVDYFQTAIKEVQASYNIDGNSKGFQNEVVNKFYYIQFWADKKGIPVNYNDKNQKNRELFNLDTIICTILADKLAVFNQWEKNKPKT